MIKHVISSDFTSDFQDHGQLLLPSTACCHRFPNIAPGMQHTSTIQHGVHHTSHASVPPTSNSFGFTNSPQSADSAGDEDHEVQAVQRTPSYGSKVSDDLLVCTQTICSSCSLSTAILLFFCVKSLLFFWTDSSDIQCLWIILIVCSCTSRSIGSYIV